MITNSDKRQSGFTIIELLIATLIFSVVMIIITVGVLSFTRSYYRGVNQSNTQRATRTILETISQAIQFSGEEITSPLTTTVNNGRTYQGVCVGGQRFSFLPGWQQIDDSPNAAQNQTRNTLVLDKPGLCGGLSAQDLSGTLSAGSVELLEPRMRISKLQVVPVTGASGTYRVTVRVVYGDNDLLNNPTADNASCQVGIRGAEYCAQAELTTIVKRRIAH